MRTVAVRNLDRGVTLGDRVGLADRWWSRLRGLLGRPGLAEGEGLFLIPCSGVHMFGMRFALDLAFVNRDGVVVALEHRIAPGERTPYHREAWAAIELPAGTLARTDTAMGDQLQWGAGPAPGKE